MAFREARGFLSIEIKWDEVELSSPTTTFFKKVLQAPQARGLQIATVNYCLNVELK